MNEALYPAFLFCGATELADKACYGPDAAFAAPLEQLESGRAPALWEVVNERLICSENAAVRSNLRLTDQGD